MADQPKMPLGAGTLTISQNALSTTAEEIVPASDTAKRVTVRNLSVTAAEVVWVGHANTAGPTTSFPLDAGTAADVHGESISFYTRDAIWAEAASGTPTVAIIVESE